MENTEILGLGTLGALRAVHNPLLMRASRAEMLAFLQSNEVTKDIKDLLDATKLKLADKGVYSIKQVDGKTTKMFETQDQKEVGLRNVSNAKLDKQHYLLASAIIIKAGYVEVELGANDGQATDSQLISGAKAAKYFAIDEDGDNLSVTPDADITPATQNDVNADPFGGLLTGEWTLKANRKDIVHEVPMSYFQKESTTQFPVGYHKFDNPRLIPDDTLIELEIELGQELDLGHFQKTAAQGGLWYAQTVFIYAELRGTMTVPA
jgi:hypothetical protein